MIRNFLKIISLKNFGKAHVEATMANSIGEIFKSKGELNKERRLIKRIVSVHKIFSQTSVSIHTEQT